MAGRAWLVVAALLMILDIALPQDVCIAQKGQDGYPGVPGRDGRPGQKGDRGDPGLPGRRTGLKGMKGDTGEPGSSGPPGMQGYKGPVGPLGPSGEPGQKGQKGTVANIREQRRPAFSAMIDPEALVKIHDKVLLFSQVITNMENRYSADSGKFLCADPGYYYFTFHVVSQGELCLFIVKEHRSQAERQVAFCDGNERAQPQVNSGGSVLKLEKGDRVWIQTDSRDKLYERADANSVFSGFLLFPENAVPREREREGSARDYFGQSFMALHEHFPFVLVSECDSSAAELGHPPALLHGSLQHTAKDQLAASPRIKMGASLVMSLGLVLLFLTLVTRVKSDTYGIPGMPGVPGIPGRDGRDGLKGPKGERGVPAMPGKSGVKGEKGESGLPGPQGKHGPMGPSGPAGQKGVPGPKGENGQPGSHKHQYQSAFTVTRLTATYPAKNSPVIFTREITNINKHYDKSTGRFTCHIPGLYYFTYHASQTYNLCVALHLDEEKKASFCDHLSNKQQVTSGGVLLRMVEGQQVWLSVNDYNGMVGKENADSVFSGFLLFPD
ncbi:uncharacterized protein LOC115076503 [Rhinatrema bivittatum]|uniref:uncharacterized protein LOC115076503 n=1 Tax=Rhinatrema bivittatum TaxID=194408 RepID=UPI001128C59F|nr:uncharacterized protein LOC115076503 [Rhinatrema bivittatum]